MSEHVACGCPITSGGVLHRHDCWAVRMSVPPVLATDDLLALARTEASVLRQEVASLQARLAAVERERDDMEAVLIEANEDIKGVTPADTIRRILRQRDEALALLRESVAALDCIRSGGHPPRADEPRWDLCARIDAALRGGEVKP